ncbi:MAG: hypothetical protein JNL53_14730 [Cyclobacteriaceae bacterium]|nr:hypothetical protein [Cyclobacteriaceae bacterium]
MKFLASYSLTVFSIFSGLIWMRQSVISPEEQLIGVWNEQSWEYEKVYSRNDQRAIASDTVSQSVKDQLGKHLVIHSAETWRFTPDGQLILTGLDTVKTVRWKLKGRGRILQLEYSNQKIENYNLTELTNNKMVLNFDSDVQVRGIAKLIFNR